MAMNETFLLLSLMIMFWLIITTLCAMMLSGFCPAAAQTTGLRQPTVKDTLHTR